MTHPDARRRERDTRGSSQPLKPVTQRGFVAKAMTDGEHTRTAPAQGERAVRLRQIPRSGIGVERAPLDRRFDGRPKRGRRLRDHAEQVRRCACRGGGDPCRHRGPRHDLRRVFPEREHTPRCDARRARRHLVPGNAEPSVERPLVLAGARQKIDERRDGHGTDTRQRRLHAQGYHAAPRSANRLARFEFIVGAVRSANMDLRRGSTRRPQQTKDRPPRRHRLPLLRRERASPTTSLAGVQSMRSTPEEPLWAE